jgi:hypothetical protein
VAYSRASRVSGHIGEKNGYATFEPTEFKVGDLEIPVSSVNPAAQKKLMEEHDRRTCLTWLAE